MFSRAVKIHESRTHDERGATSLLSERNLRAHLLMFYSGRPHSQNGLPESVDVSGFVFSPVIFRTKASWRSVGAGRFTVSPEASCLNCNRSPPSIVTARTDPAGP